MTALDPDFPVLYASHAAGLYGLCHRLQGSVEASERLFADVWKRVYECFPENGDPAVVLSRHLAETYRRAARTGEQAGAGAAAALLTLAPEYRLPLVLRDCGGLSYPSIASALDVPKATVRARLARARALLRPGLAAGPDDELLSAHLDGELEPGEVVAVEALLQREQSWRTRLAALRTEAETLRALPVVPLCESTRDIVFRSVTESFAMGAERRRVPRYKRRWMLLAALAVPCVLTLVYLQNPTHDSRLYLRGDELALRAGRSGEKTTLPKSKQWTSPPLWGVREGGEEPTLAFQVDAGNVASRTITAGVDYDFDGDGKADRAEEYAAVNLDDRTGWERLRMTLKSGKGEWRDFQGGRVTIRLRSPEPGPAMELSGTPGELVLPYRHLRAEL